MSDEETIERAVAVAAEHFKNLTPRDPARISKVLSAVEHYWRTCPDQRLGQIISNFAGGGDPFYMEDDTLALRIEEAMWCQASQKENE